MRQPSTESSPGDAVAAFLETLRRFVAFVCVYLFWLVESVVCALLLIVGILLPWRFLPLVCGCGGASISVFKYASMQEFRETSSALARCAVQDLLMFPFALVALLTPSRADVVLRETWLKLSEFTPQQRCRYGRRQYAYDTSLRLSLVALGLSAPWISSE